VKTQIKTQKNFVRAFNFDNPSLWISRSF